MATLICSTDEGVLNYKVHVAFSVSPDPYPSGATVGSYGKTLENVTNNATVTIKASETTCRDNYTFPVYVYTKTSASAEWSKVDYLQSGTVTFSAGTGTKYVKVGPATKSGGGSTSSYKVKITKGEGISQISYGINTNSVSQIISNTTATLDVEKKGGYVYIGIARYSTGYTYPVYIKPSIGNQWVAIKADGTDGDRYISGPDSSGVREVEIYATPIRYYRVHADANGGSFDGDGAETVWNSGLITQATSSSIIYYQLSNIPTPSRSGYTFAGWGTSSGNAYGSTAAINVGSSSSSNPANLTVYALWTENAKTFKFRLSDTNVGVSAYYVYVNGTQKIASTSTSWSTLSAFNSDTIEIRVAIKGIYNSAGTLVNGNGFEAPLITAYGDSSSYNDISEYMTINTEGSATTIPTYKGYSFLAGKRPNHHSFAIGAVAKTYGYVIYANDGSWPSGTDPQRGTVKSTQQLNLANFTPTYFGYAQLGWHTIPTASLPSASYPLNESIYLTGSLTLYAIWTKKYYIIFDANGGKWSNRASTTKPCEAYYTKIIYLGAEDAGDIAKLSRGGNTLSGWSDTSKTVRSYLPDARFECPNRTTNLTMYAIWEKKSIDKFYWYNNDTQDNTYIAEGKPITNLKASAWNRLKKKIEEVSEATGITLPNAYDSTQVDPTTQISATDYNGVRLAIVNLPGSGTGPAVAAKDMVIGASMFVGTNSLKDAINKAIDKWNNS